MASSQRLKRGNDVQDEPGSKRRRLLTIGSDFSGLNMLFIAARKLSSRLPRFKPVSAFASDKAQACQQISKCCHDTLKFHSDILLRDNAELMPVDIYSFTPPCVTFSQLGRQTGEDGPTGQLWKESIKYVAKHKPKIVIAENSSTLAGQFASVGKKIIQAIREAGYVVEASVLDTQDYAIPHRRRRWYLLAVRKDICRSNFESVPWFPTPLRYCVSLIDLIKPLPKSRWKCTPPKNGNSLHYKNVMDAYREVHAAGVNPFEVPIIIDFHSSERFSSYKTNVCPPLTKSRCSSFGYWCSLKGGVLSIDEYMKLQGLDASDLPFRTLGISDSAFAGSSSRRSRHSSVVLSLVHIV